MFRKWKIEKRVKEGVETWNVRILRGKYKGLLYHYGMVRFVEPLFVDGPARLQFELYPVEVGKKGFDPKDPTLIQLTGDILKELIGEKPDKYGEVLVREVKEGEDGDYF